MTNYSASSQIYATAIPNISGVKNLPEIRLTYLLFNHALIPHALSRRSELIVL